MRVERSNLNGVLSKAIAYLGWTEANGARVADDYLRFLGQSRAHDAPFPPPSADVDALWHMHMIHPVHYADFCEQHFGAVIDHHVAETPVDTADRDLLTLMAGTGCNRPHKP
jgi:hypothetical protein